MKKILVRLSAAIMMCSMVLSTGVACNKEPSDTKDPKTLYISAWDSGYGIEWLNKVKAAYEAKNPEITVKIESTTLADKAVAPLSSKTYYDVVFCDNLELVEGSQYAKFPGYETNYVEITDIVTSEIEGENVSIKDKLNSQALEFSDMDGKFFYLPVMASIWGLSYNKDILSNYYIPKTSYEMQLLCNELKSDSSVSAPIIFAGDADYWDSILWTWWAQYDGSDSFNAFFQGADANGKMSLDIFSSLGRLRALEEVETFLTPNNGYCDSRSSGYLYMQAQLKYLQGKYAFMANGSWLENEMAASFKDSGTEMANIEFMEIPVISSIVEKLSFYEDGDTSWIELSNQKKQSYDEKLSAIVAYVDAGMSGSLPSGIQEEDIAIVKSARDIFYLTGLYYSVVIPCYTEKANLAKDFLKFMYSNEGITSFLSTDLGSILPVKYDSLNLSFSGARKVLADALTYKDVIMYNFNHPAVRLGGLVDFAIPGTLEVNFGSPYVNDRHSAYEVFMYDYNYYRNGNAWSNILSAVGLN